jgi:hypothetical protein
VNETIAAPERLIGEVAVVSSGSHSAACTAAAVDGSHIVFEGPAITGMVVAESHDAQSVTTKTRLSGYGTQLAARNLIGMTLVNEARDASAAIASVESGAGGVTFRLAGPVDFRDADGDGRTRVWFADFGPGASVGFSPWAEMILKDGQHAQIAGNTAVTPSQDSP